MSIWFVGASRMGALVPVSIIQERMQQTRSLP